MRRLILALLCVLWAVPAGAACGGGASPNWTSSADHDLLAACIATASPGDTITVTGTATWTTPLTFSRGVKLVGSGNPTITGKTIMFKWRPDAAARAAHDTLEIRGFTLDGNGATPADMEYGGGLVDLESTPTDYVTVVIRDNTFRNTSSKAFYISGRFYGVIARNTIDNIYIPIGIYGKSQQAWANYTQVYGTANNLYFEDNTIQYSSAASTSRALAGGQGGQIVMRYNTFNFANLTSNAQMWEVHGLQSMTDALGDQDCGYPGHPDCDPTITTYCDSYSMMTTEAYGNKAYNWPSSDQWMAQRGGWMLMFNNTYSATTGDAATIGFYEYACDSCQKYGATLSPNVGPYVMHVANTYVWNNFDRGSRVGMTKIRDICGDYSIGKPYTITENRDYYNFKSDFATNPTTGVGCGSSRPATCTTGTAYWETNQSCSDVTGMVGVSPATPISGTLYKCTATNTWTAYYTPYTYPHPLAGGGVAPNAPTNVRIR